MIPRGSKTRMVALRYMLEGDRRRAGIANRAPEQASTDTIQALAATELTLHGALREHLASLEHRTQCTFVSPRRCRRRRP